MQWRTQKRVLGSNISFCFTFFRRIIFSVFNTAKCAFNLKIHQNAFGGQAPPGPAEGAYSAPSDPRNKGEGREKGGRDGWKGWKEKWKGKEVEV